MVRILLRVKIVTLFVRPYLVISFSPSDIISKSSRPSSSVQAGFRTCVSVGIFE